MNFVYFGFVVAISLLSHVQCENVTLSEFEERAAIVNGYNAPNRPFYVEIRINTRGMSWTTCGGTIISAHHVLSAAHCFADGHKSILVLVGDASNPNYKKTSKKIQATVTYHSGFTGSPDFKNDVALLTLSQGVSSSLALPLCTKSYSQYPITVCGMGQTSGYIFDSMPNQLQETQLQEESSCGTFSTYPYNFDKTKQICLGPIKGNKKSSACFGDSGGPAFPLSKSGQPICAYGIVSYAEAKPPCSGNSVYTRVSAYASWINQHL